MLLYRLTFERDDNDTILVTSPDLPLVSFGVTLAEAARNAEDAAVTLLQSMMDDDGDIPFGAPAPHDGSALRLAPEVVLKIALHRELRAVGWTRTELARKLGWRLPLVRKLFDLRARTRLDVLSAAFAVFGKAIDVRVTEGVEQAAAA